jgi:hypothetical protein
MSQADYDRFISGFPKDSGMLAEVAFNVLESACRLKHHDNSKGNLAALTCGARNALQNNFDTVIKNYAIDVIALELTTGIMAGLSHPDQPRYQNCTAP